MTKPAILFGPTAVGKTALSVELAKQFNGEIISADSMQVYRHMDIGTAKPSKEQRSLVPHHLIDVVDPDESWTVSDFIERTNVLIKELSSKGKLPLIVGGTGLYLNALINGYSFPIAAKDDAIRKRLEKLDVKEIYGRLKAADPDAAEKISSNDRKRMIRALEVFEQTGIPITKLQKKKENKNLKLICLNTEREKLYERINQRVDGMIKDGLVDEVKGLLEKGYTKSLQSMQALGYKEVIGYLNDEYGHDEMVELIKRKTRNFARRQLTWFKRFPNVRWIESGDIATSGYQGIRDILEL